MPMQRDRYPVDWDAISQRIRERAGGYCERCGAPNHRYITRGVGGYTLYADALAAAMARDKGTKVTYIVLTVAHLPTAADTMDCRPEVLQALCQKCHLDLDRQQHLRNARATRDRKRGQKTLTMG